MIPTPPHTCRHTWTASRWAPRAPLPQVSRCSPQAAQRWPLQLLLPGHLPSFIVYLQRICWPCVMVCFTLCCLLLWGKLIKKGNSVKLVSNLMPYWQKKSCFSWIWLRKLHMKARPKNVSFRRKNYCISQTQQWRPSPHLVRVYWKDFSGPSSSSVPFFHWNWRSATLVFQDGFVAKVPNIQTSGKWKC